MLPSSIRTFWSLTHAPCTPLSVLVARATASLMASSKLVCEVALNSVTLATLIDADPPFPSLVFQLDYVPKQHIPNIRAGVQRPHRGKLCEPGVCLVNRQGTHPRNGVSSCLGKK